MEDYPHWSYPLGHAAPTSSSYSNSHDTSSPQPYNDNNYNIASPKRSDQEYQWSSFQYQNINMIASPASQSYNNTSTSSPQVQQSQGNFVVASPTGQPYNNYDFSSPQSQVHGNFASSPHRQNYSCPSPPRQRYGISSPHNSSFNSYGSPQISPGSWSTTSPENVNNSTTMQDYKNPFDTIAPPGTPLAALSLDIPLLPENSNSQEYERVPYKKTQYAGTGKIYQRSVGVDEIKRQSKVRQQQEKIMMQSGKGRVPMGGHVPLKRLIQMTTSSRKRRGDKAVPHHQTVNAFKYKLHHDREMIAQSKALDLFDLLSQ